MWHKMQIFVILLIVIVHEYGVNASGTAPKKLKKKDIFNPHDHYLHDERTKFPGRLTCLECDSKNDENCKSNPSDEKLVDCLYPHLCYHFRNVSSGDTQRGCTKNIKGYFLERCEGNQDECKVCKGTNCNDAERFVKCANCTSSVECAALSTIRMARTKICPQYRDECFTYIGREGVERGCMSNKPDAFKEKCRGNEEKCSICVDPVDHEECNRKPFDLEFCVGCDVKKDGKFCHMRPSLFRNYICNSITSTTKEGCYLSIKGDEHKKGCVRELSNEDAMECQRQSSQCKTCSNTNCNMKTDFATWLSG